MKYDKSGFTLVEVMVAASLLALILGGGLATLIQGSRLVEDARDMTRVSQIMQSEIEAMRTMNWADLEGLPKERMEVPLSGGFADKFKDKYKIYREVTDHNSGQKSVNVVVEWTSPRGLERTQSHHTRMTKGGLNDYYYRTF